MYFLVVVTVSLGVSVIDCLERIVSKMICVKWDSAHNLATLLPDKVDPHCHYHLKPRPGATRHRQLIPKMYGINFIVRVLYKHLFCIARVQSCVSSAFYNKNLAIANRSRVSCINTNNNTMTLKSGLDVTQGH